MNETKEENGLVPYKLVFLIVPRFPIQNTILHSQTERMQTIKRAQLEMINIIADRRVLAALTRHIPPLAGKITD